MTPATSMGIKVENFLFKVVLSAGMRQTMKWVRPFELRLAPACPAEKAR